MKRIEVKWFPSALLFVGLLMNGCGGGSDGMSLDVSGSYSLTYTNRLLTGSCTGIPFPDNGFQVQWTVLNSGGQLNITDSVQSLSFQGVLKSDDTFEASLTTLIFTQSYTGQFTAAGISNGHVTIVIPEAGCTASFDFAGPKQ
jgi:hypothetical protein